MGNTESTLPELALENENSENDVVTESRRRRLRRRQAMGRQNAVRPTMTTATTATMANSTDDDNSWWWDVENQNLILDQVPNELTSVTDLVESENRAELRVLQKLANEDINSTLKFNINDNNNNNNINNNISTDIENETENNAHENVEINKIDDFKDPTERTAIREQSLEEFREELRQKRLARQNACQDLRDEVATLRKQLAIEQALTQSLRQNGDVVGSLMASVPGSLQNSFTTNGVVGVQGDGALGLDTDDVDPMSRGRHANIELANAQLALQLANSENISLRAELAVVQKQVGTLKEVISCCKQMLVVKEEQCNELKAKLTEIETSFGEREMKIMSDNLRHEYERQLGNIRQLRELYEERQRISSAEHENLQRLISIKKDELLAEQEKTKNFEERNQTLIKEVESANNELATLREECNEHKFEKKALKEEMGAVNTLFSQMVMGFNGKNNLDIDRLTTMLEENRTLLNDMATKEASCTDGATLPKLLFELVEQATLNGNSNSNRSSRSSTPTSTFEETPNDIENNAECKERKDSHPSENAATNMNNDVPAHVGDVDAVDDGSNICYGAAANSQLNIATNCGNKYTKKQQQQQQRCSKNKLQTITTSSSSSTSTSEVEVGVGVGVASNESGVEVEVGKAASAGTTLKFHEPEVIGKVASTQEIIGNLPKVWKVLMELLSHHSIEQVQFEENGNGEDCYKSVETPNGPKAELSVSKTYIKLKDLILEKKSLVKETNRLKTLNSHLEYRLNTQEKRLSTVSLELTKTWHLVGKMQRQHRQLHTQEQILRYQLQQKRRLLSELKEELEYCRRKWAAARAKNDESQEQCNDLRREFARRKLEDANNSAESGYSDSGPPSDEEERGAVAIMGGGGGVGGCANSRRKHLREMFEHTRKIKRMQSTSPGRAAAYARVPEYNGGDDGGDGNSATQETEIVLRWNSAPPTCGWRRRDNADTGDGDGDGDGDEDVEEELPPRMLVVSRGARGARGAIPKQNAGSRNENPDTGNMEHAGGSNASTEGRATRIQRLEEQCKSLIQQVLETSDNRERLEIQLCQFQDEIAPVQYAVPLEEFINRRRVERMSRASSAPATGTLTPREEEYTRKRSERLERLEEESRQLMSRIKRTSDRGHYLRCSLDRIRRMPSREESFDSAAEDESKKVNPMQETSIEEDTEKQAKTKSVLTAEEEAYTTRRAARLMRLEAEGQQLIGNLTRNAQRGDNLETRIDTLHERYERNRDNNNNNVDTTAEITTTLPQESINVDTALSIEERLETIDQVTANRAARLRLLEEEGNQLIARLANTSERGTRMINRIAEREQRREARLHATASVDSAPDSKVDAETETETEKSAPAATALLPTLKNVACTSIVSDEVTECVTVTTTPSRVATRELGAIPKSKPTAQLCAARHKSERFTAEKRANDERNSTVGETLEDLVNRLRDTPFPEGKQHPEGIEKTEESANVLDIEENAPEIVNVETTVESANQNETSNEQ